ncbi:MAG: MFS transporter [Lactobacillus iners]|nr:MFS transporter [Lactobacillus iners]MCT7737276.1 MFS transporter [Lactobacillus iners]MCT7756259.1 MFS transporter [Lactobacillus iners]MCT7786599.1 MFS transporter [Lactobacillus iners]MDK7226596.1 MFS transporter [Lactobacillus iners]MDK7305877.1 MFS transporter [Lactobacillus iners]
MAILWYFKENRNSQLMVSILFTISSGIDMMSFSLGPLIDKISIKGLLKYSTFIQIVISIIVVTILGIGQKSYIIDIILLLLFTISSILSAIIYPSEYKLLPLFVTKKDLLRFNGLFQVTYKILDLILDGITTFIITFSSVSFTIIFSAVIFGIALLFYHSIQINILAKNILEDDSYFTSSYFNDLLLGWKTLRKEKSILELILPLCVVNLFYGIFAVGLPFFAQTYIQTSALGYGKLLIASSFGSIIGAFLVQKFDLGKKNMGQFIAICFLGAGIFRLFVPLSVSVGIGLVLINSVISPLWITMMNTNFEALVQTSFSSAILGRVETINDSLLSIMIPIGTLLGGWIVKSYGSLITQYIYGIALICSSIYYFMVEKSKNIN